MEARIPQNNNSNMTFWTFVTQHKKKKNIIKDKTLTTKRVAMKGKLLKFLYILTNDSQTLFFLSCVSSVFLVLHQLLPLIWTEQFIKYITPPWTIKDNKAYYLFKKTE